MRDGIILLGGTDATIAVAEAALDVGIRIACIVTPGQSFSISYSPSPVQNVRAFDAPAWSAKYGVPVVPFTSYDDVLDIASAASVPLCIAVGWYHMVPRRFRSAFPRGCLGFHASLLPELRGGAPLNWAILAGLEETGVTLFELGDGVDDGLIYAQERFPIAPRAVIGDLVKASQAACAEITRRALPEILAGRGNPRAQTGSGSYGLQRRPEDGRIDWRTPALNIDRLVRAVSRPYPGAFAALEGEIVRVWASDIPELPVVHGMPGQIARLAECAQPCVVTGAGLLAIVEATDERGNDVLDKLLRSGHKRFHY